MFFYCDKCRKKKNWPESLTMSIGPCGICGNIRSCWNVKTSNLPKDNSNQQKNIKMKGQKMSKEKKKKQSRTKINREAVIEQITERLRSSATQKEVFDVCNILLKTNLSVKKNWLVSKL